MIIIPLVGNMGFNNDFNNKLMLSLCAVLQSADNGFHWPMDDG